MILISDQYRYTTANPDLALQALVFKYNITLASARIILTDLKLHPVNINHYDKEGLDWYCKNAFIIPDHTYRGLGSRLLIIGKVLKGKYKFITSPNQLNGPHDVKIHAKVMDLHSYFTLHNHDMECFTYFEKNLHLGINEAFTRLGVNERKFSKMVYSDYLPILIDKYPESKDFIEKHLNLKNLGFFDIAHTVPIWERTGEGSILTKDDIINCLRLRLIHVYGARYIGWVDSGTKVEVEGESIYVHHHTLFRSLDLPLPVNMSEHPSIRYKDELYKLAVATKAIIEEGHQGVKFKLPEVLDRLDKSKWKHLDTPTAMINEGKIMNHCVGGESYIRIATFGNYWYFHYDDGSVDGITIEIRVHDRVVSDTYVNMYIFGEVYKSHNDEADVSIREQLMYELYDVQKTTSVDSIVDHTNVLFFEVCSSIIEPEERGKLGIVFYVRSFVVDLFSLEINPPYVKGLASRRICGEMHNSMFKTDLGYERDVVTDLCTTTRNYAGDYIGDVSEAITEYSASIEQSTYQRPPSITFDSARRAGKTSMVGIMQRLRILPQTKPMVNITMHHPITKD